MMCAFAPNPMEFCIFAVQSGYVIIMLLVLDDDTPAQLT
jgi:hypothetical protein